MNKIYLFITLFCLLLTTGAEAKGTVNLKGVDTYGSLVGPDGSDWFYTQNFTESKEFSYAYGSTDITIYDNDMEQVMTIHYDVPAGVKTNTIEPYGQVTNKFFDYKESTLEVMVYVHSLGEFNEETYSYEQIHENYIFSGEYEGEAQQIFKYDSQNLAVLDASVGYDINQRMCLVTQEGDTVKTEVYKRGKWSSKGTSTPILEHTFKLPAANVNYAVGSWINTYTIDGKFYYVVSYYEKPYSESMDENYEPIRTENNHFVAEVYDQDYNIVQKVRVSADPNPDTPFTFHGIGRFYKDLTKGYYTGDDQLNLVLCYDNYIIASDESAYDFKVFGQGIAGDNEVSQPVKTIFEGAATWNFLSDIPGQESQIGVLRGSGYITEEGESSEIAMINLPSCKEATVFPSVIEGHKVNWNFDRVPVGGSEYNYVFALNEGETDSETDEALGLIGWYTPDCKQVRIDKLSIGTNGQMFKPMLSSDFYLGRYVFNGDDLVEYPYLAKRTKKLSTVVETAVRIANQNGELVKEYKPATGKSLQTASFLNYNSTKPYMVVVYTDNVTQKCDIVLDPMPFETMDGFGSEGSPYLIKTAGDLARIASNGSGYYQIVNDIDMSLLGKQYVPATNFSGSIDGDGHTISNLYVDVNQYNVGLIGTSIYGSNYAKNYLKNIILENPTIKTGSLASHAGFFVGWAQNTIINNCFVKNGLIDASSYGATVGGVVGQMGTQSGIKECGVFDSRIMAPTSPVGGIVGKAIFNSSVSACAFTNSEIVGGSSVGGIMGAAEDGTSPVTDCHVNATIKGRNSVGGVVGSSQRSNAVRNFVELKELSAEVDNSDNTYSAGGVLGYLETAWEESTCSVSSNVVVPAEGTASIWDDIAGKKAWHRIIGFTAQDETYGEGERRKTEKGANNNYALSGISANGSKGITTPDGADIETLSMSFFNGLSFAYGTSSSSPWKDNDGRPSLYFEDINTQTAIHDITLSPESEGSIFNLNGMRVGNNAKGIMIVVRNGKAVKVVK